MRSPISPSELGSQAQALLQGVTDDRDRRCAALRAAAEGQAQQIVRSARTEARANVRDAVVQERARLELGLRQAAARADIEVRRRERQKSRELLEQMWAAIADSLERRWREPAPRQAWIDAVMSMAATLLPGRAWLIEVGSNWTQRERTELADQARRRGAGGVDYTLQAGMPAGLRIRAGEVCVDATVPGLLADRDAIEAAFLVEYMPALAASKSTTQRRTDA